jgi:hypothetical protein
MREYDSRTFVGEFQDSLPVCTLPLPVIEGVEFKHVPGIPGWCAGTDGSVWSCRAGSRQGPHFKDEWKRLEPQINKDTGYYCLSVRDKGNGKRGTHYIHKIILNTFVGPCPPGMRCRHKYDIKTDNRLSEISWGTPRQNGDDARKNGRTPKGETASRNKLTEKMVLRARELASTGMGYINVYDQIRGEFSEPITYGSLYMAMRGKSWTHLPMPKSSESLDCQLTDKEILKSLFDKYADKQSAFDAYVKESDEYYAKGS